MNKKFKNILLFIFIVVIFIGIGFTNGKNRKVTVVESIFSGIVTFPQKCFTYLKNWVIKDASFFETVDTLKANNQQLKEQNEELNAKLMNYEVILSENTILKEHVNLKDSYPDYNVIVADVINESASNWEKIYTINRGSRDGVMPDMTVVTEDGLVGYVGSVTNSTDYWVYVVYGTYKMSANDYPLRVVNSMISEDYFMRVTSEVLRSNGII